MIYKLKNEELEVAFTTKGGTLCSIKGADGLEYLWQGDAQYWSGQAPILFPICGSIRDDKAVIGKQKTTSMSRHGIVRKREFEFIEQTENAITFMIQSNEEMKQQFPYGFQLFATYILDHNTIQVTYAVKNTGEEAFPFFVGGHPGFNCPLVPGESYTDYQLVFDQKETCTVPTPVTETGLIDMEHRTAFLKDSNVVELSHEMFEQDATILDEIKSRKVTLRSKKSGKSVTLTFKDFPYLILWSSANHGNFVALEPWMGLSTCSDESDVFEEKRGVQTVESGETKSYSYQITVGAI